MIQHILEYAGIAVLATSGAVVGVRKGFDLFGIAVSAALTGIGGNLLRDVLLGVFPPASLQRWAPITVCVVAALLTTMFAKLVIRLSQLVLVLDAIGMGFFATTGAAISVDHGASYFAAALLGMVSAVAGTIMRDVVARDVPMVMGPDDMYAAPAVLGSVVYVVIDSMGSQWLGVAIGSLVATLLRLAAITFHWRLPTGPRELHVRPDPDDHHQCAAASQLRPYPTDTSSGTSNA
ncbi:trimeric intracellular cation channel family protein [Mycolicibacterium aichiense]|uniref:Membrane protein n=1 Tax=Mycolicibacterium aichiense TaxID=1799 RepID=A0AAD1HN11_9MYCO|nr:trimeric intracellular cation channel family protein [Mycolicibacterium aichiense]MCV7019062.1 trimeric intracellular cation channel family protein [Mycolicibacterium aichiense]BBX08392.1 membrane protein [Mycolicibacterium aichiense]STZ82192.1 Predicted membrane protein [Mycolicibacterium aichiense]